MNSRIAFVRFAAVALFALVLGACATTISGPPPEVARLQSELDRLHGDQRVAGFAEQELARARAAVDDLARNARSMDEELYVHDVYIADRLVQTAEAAGMARYAEFHGQELGAERDRLVAEARTRDLSVAQATANAAQATASVAQATASVALQEAEIQRRDAEASRQEASNARAELAMMRDRLIDLETRETERGLVITLGDVLFETDRAELKPGATRELDQLAAALREDPTATISIEGHTDSTGSRGYNLDLSDRRAASVRNYLAGHGVAPSRLTSSGLGPDYPVASNDNQAGRQQNRRVEVVVQTQVAFNRPR